ncbi:hypothetical protein FVEN_g12838 [Fusarium venenatum]|uniref:Uncharacterized protein n=1 Tax=Fusarium venenatum TaxID=56646 RepID=A0A2L2T8Z4_9HYPO|nr:uncharacterized protein FVRRES_03866 [Fusarium venenatum]KAG8356400.1 hypothetical protein FVEN_g12838 [Fusarium venenatum]CEI67354.1 unnamed protein product [Fusarium venenatum]
MQNKVDVLFWDFCSSMSGMFSAAFLHQGTIMSDKLANRNSLTANQNNRDDEYCPSPPKGVGWKPSECGEQEIS